jgi:hypothetical protein
MPTTIGTAQLDAIARNFRDHGTGAANVARLARLFRVTEESLTGAVALANATSAETVTETAPATTDPVLLDRATRFARDVVAAEAKPLPSASTADLEALLAAAMPR